MLGLTARGSELNEAGLRGASLLVFGSPREKFNKGEIEAIQACAPFLAACPLCTVNPLYFTWFCRYVRNGGSMLVLMYEGGEEKLPTNINFLLEQWGIFAKPDAIVPRLHPLFRVFL